MYIIQGGGIDREGKSKQLNVHTVFAHKVNMKSHEHECKIEQGISIWGFLEHRQHIGALFDQVNTLDAFN